MTLEIQVLYIKSKSFHQKKIFFGKKIFHWRNGSKDGEEDATKHGWDKCYRNIQETKKSPQSKEDQ